MQFLLLTISVCVALKPQLQNDVRDQEEFKLTIIHTNDVHAHFMESDGRYLIVAFRFLCLLGICMLGNFC